MAAIFFILCLTSGVALAQSDAERGANRASVEPMGFLYGGAVGVRREIYKGYDRRVVPIPILGYRGEKLNVFGPFVSYEISRSGDFRFSARLQPRFAGFDDSDSYIFEGMAERKFSMDVGIGLNYERDNWKFEASALHDALDRSNGAELTAGLGRVFRAGRVFIEPEIGLGFMSSRLVDYYYGVEPAESTGLRPEFRGDTALNTTLGVTLSTLAFFDGLTRIGLENTWYDSTISDSPLADADSSLSLLVAFSKFF